MLPSLYLLCSLLFQAFETSLDHIILTSSPNSEHNIDSHSIMPTGERPCRPLTVQLYDCISSQSQYPNLQGLSGFFSHLLVCCNDSHLTIPFHGQRQSYFTQYKHTVLLHKSWLINSIWSMQMPHRVLLMVFKRSWVKADVKSVPNAWLN